MAKKEKEAIDVLEVLANGGFEDFSMGKQEQVKDWVDSGNYALNRIISGDYFKGYPMRKLIELFGEPSAGKSALLNTAQGNFQRKYDKMGVIIPDDPEDGFVPDYAAIMGVDLARWPKESIQSETVEDHFRNIWEGAAADKDMKRPKIIGKVPFLLEKVPDAKIMVTLDSVAILSTDHERSTGVGISDMTKAKVLRAGVRRNWPLVTKNDIIYMVVNHVMSEIKQYGPAGRTTGGGRAIPFMSSVRVELTHKKQLKSGDVVIGIETEAFIKKNKVSRPFGRCIIKIIFDKGIDRMSGVLPLLLSDGIITKSRKQNEEGYKSKDGKWFSEKDFSEELFLSLFDKRSSLEKEKQTPNEK